LSFGWAAFRHHVRRLPPSPCEQSDPGEVLRGFSVYEKNGFCRIRRSELPAAFPVTAVDTIFYRPDLLS